MTDTQHTCPHCDRDFKTHAGLGQHLNHCEDNPRRRDSLIAPPDIKQRLQFAISNRIADLERQLAQAEHNIDSAIADAREAEDRAEQAERQLAEQRAVMDIMFHERPLGSPWL